MTTIVSTIAAGSRREMSSPVPHCFTFSPKVVGRIQSAGQFVRERTSWRDARNQAVRLSLLPGMVWQGKLR